MNSVTGPWDAEIGLLHLAENGGTGPVRLVPRATAFTVLALVAVGQNLMEFVDDVELFVFVRNRSRSCTLLQAREVRSPDPQRAALSETFQVPFDGGWVAHEGDVLDACATFKVTAGVHTTYTTRETRPVIVV